MPPCWSVDCSFLNCMDHNAFDEHMHCEVNFKFCKILSTIHIHSVHYIVSVPCNFFSINAKKIYSFSLSQEKLFASAAVTMTSAVQVFCTGQL